jgi:hypothetical protein
MRVTVVTMMAAAFLSSGCAVLGQSGPATTGRMQLPGVVRLDGPARISRSRSPISGPTDEPCPSAWGWTSLYGRPYPRSPLAGSFYPGVRVRIHPGSLSLGGLSRK